MSYWLAPALEELRGTINRLSPNRDKASDGWIGDKSHASRDSDHNPSNWPQSWSGVVRAYDFDVDFGGGRTGRWFANRLASMLGKHEALGSGAYVIFDSKIISTDRLDEGWRPYNGANPHVGHVHLSVGRSPRSYNSTDPWDLIKEDVMNAAQERKLDQAAADAAAAKELAGLARDRGKINTRLMLRIGNEIGLQLDDIEADLEKLGD